MAVFSNEPKEVSQKRGEMEPESRSTEREEVADSLVTSALSLEAIARRAGWKDRRWAWSYYRRTNQLAVRRESKRLCRQEISRLVASLINEQKRQIAVVQIAQILAYNRASNAEKKTFEYFQKSPRSSYSWAELEEKFARYFNAKRDGKTPLVRELADGSGLSEHQFYMILRKVGLPSLYKHRPSEAKKRKYKTPKRLTAEQKKILEPIFSLPISAPDIAYFIDSTCRAVAKNFHRKGNRPFSQEWIDYLGPIQTNRLASKIYYAVDSGFDVEEAAEYYSVTICKVNYALKHRQTIEPRIISILREIYPCREINKPYLEELL